MNDPIYTVNQVLDRYARDCLDDLAPRTQKDYRRHLPVLRHWFGERIANELKPRDFGPFMDVKKGKQQRNKQLAILSSAFSFAVSAWFMMDSNILPGVRRHQSKPRDRLISDEEFAAVRGLMPRRVQLAMDLALITGQRQGDVLNMRWADIKDMELHVYQSKTGKRLAIEISPELESILDQCWMLPSGGKSGATHAIVAKNGRPYTSDGFRALWQRGMKKATKGYLHSSRSKRHFVEPIITSRFTFHDIRALCATKCPSVEYASYLLGHSSTALTRRVYRRGVERVKPLRLTDERLRVGK